MSHRVLIPVLGGIVALAFPTTAPASDIQAVWPVTNQILMVHLDDGYVIHHKKGQKRNEETVVVDPLNTTLASQPASWRLRSTGDPAYATARTPVHVGRKSKGTDFAWFVDQYVDGMTINTRPDHAKEHWIFLTLPSPLQNGKTYTLNTGTLAKNGANWTFTYDPTKSQSEAVRVNTLGYTPDSPRKSGFIWMWMGDRGGLDVAPLAGRTFWLVNPTNGAKVFTGQVRLGARANQPETGHPTDSPPYGNFLGADVAQCDFTAFTTPGTYVLAVDGVGRSFPFRIDPDVYRDAYFHTARALYHNRSGIALTKPYTEFERPAPHNPLVTPGFAGKLMYTTVRMQEWGSEGGNRAALEANFKGPLETSGWYQDAGDWDSYVSHLRVPQELLLAYEISPENFADGDLNIPESGNGIPDLLDEAAWLPNFARKLRAELLRKKWGTGGIGLRIAGDAFGGDGEGVPSYEDVNRTWAVSGEDPESTYRYAGTAAQLAYCLSMPQTRYAPSRSSVDWVKEAREAFDWAANNTRPGDQDAVRPHRAYAAAALFRITGDKRYERVFEEDTRWITPTTLVYESNSFGPFIYAHGGGKATRNPALLERIRAALLHTADEIGIRTPAKRATGWGGDFFFPMLVGQQTTPWVANAAIGWALTKTSDPAKVRQYRTAMVASCDYMLGLNGQNLTWMTGVGPRPVRQIFHMDAWYNGKNQFHPGMIPYGPWRKERDQGRGPWDEMWPNKTLYPSIDAWPGNERWYENRCAPMSNEFTVHQNLGPAAAMYGLLLPPRSSASKPAR